VVADPSRLPLRDASIDAVVMEDVAAGFELDAGSLPALARELMRVVAPAGAVFVGVENRMFRLPVLRRLAGTDTPMPLNRWIKRAGWPRVRLSAGRLRRAMTGAGFGAPATYAPLPGPDDAKVVLPLDDARAVRYFLNSLVRKNSRFVRLAIRLADLLLALGLFRCAVAYRYLIFRKDASGS
jgi:hypothetical protein